MMKEPGGTQVLVRVMQMPGEGDLPLPEYMTPHASGLDLLAACRTPVEISQGGRATIPTGLKLEIPRGYEGQVRPRSGLAARAGVTVLNAPGTIDADYRGEVRVILINLGGAPFTVRRGDRIAQLVICPIARARLEPHTRLDETHRGEGGFGHTGGFGGEDTPA